MKSIILNALIVLVEFFVWFYIRHPAINIHSAEFWMLFLVTLCLIVFLHKLRVLRTKPKQVKPKKPFLSQVKGIPADLKKKLESFGVLVLIVVAAIMMVIVIQTIYSPVFMAKKYANRIKVTNVDFNEIPVYEFNKTAIIDRDSSLNLGDKVMGQMTDLVSQFRVSPEYSQISYQEGTYRVTPLAYDGFIKYFKNRSEGIPGYIIVNTTTGETSLKRLNEKMRYVPSAYFNENLYRKLRFDHPFTIFGDPTFEIDEQGNPYYVCTTYTYQGYRSLRRVTGVILLDPVTGKSQIYNLGEEPKWIDRIYPETLVNQELDDYGQYQKGYINSIIGQEGVIKTSPGYNYISKEGDIWLYTGMTSVSSDESNVGFMLVNLRTHEAQFISSSGASEYAVMASAEGEVLNYGYTATFPVLVNVDNKPVYLLSLKDSAGLIKMYAMVDAQDYQQVYTIKADRNSQLAINELINQLSDGTVYDDSTFIEKEITIDQIRNVVIEGNTYLYLKSGDESYQLLLNKDNAAVSLFLEENQKIKIFYNEVEGNLVIYKLELIKE